MQSDTMDKDKLEAMAKEMAKSVKSEADLAAVTRTMMKTLIETALKAELTEHLGYDEGELAPTSRGNSRNGSTESPRVCWRPFGLSQAATADSFSC